MLKFDFFLYISWSIQLSLNMPRHNELSPEDFLKVLNDTAVQEKLCEIFNNSIKLIVREIFDPIEKQMKKDIDELKATIQPLQLKIDERTEQLKNLQAVNSTLSEKLVKERMAREELEQYSRRENLIITGIPATLAERVGADQGEQNRLGYESSTVTTNKVVTFCNEVLHLDINPSDISIAHRCKLRRGSDIPPILVRFVRRFKRDEVFRAKALLKTYNASRPINNRSYINEDLTESNRRLMGVARKAVVERNLDSAWSSNCRIFVKTIAGRRLIVSSIHELNEVIG
jgi:prefoldin subunit 5